MDEIRINIIRKGGHYEGYINGEFVCSGDTINEVREDLYEIAYPVKME